MVSRGVRKKKRRQAGKNAWRREYELKRSGFEETWKFGA